MLFQPTVFHVLIPYGPDSKLRSSGDCRAFCAAFLDLTESVLRSRFGLSNAQIFWKQARTVPFIYFVPKPFEVHTIYVTIVKLFKS